MDSRHTGHAVLIICLVVMTTGAPVTDIEEAKEFMEKYGYGGAEHPDPSMSNLDNNGTVERALYHYQANMGLPQTGVLDNATMEMMSKPRCGMPDVMGQQDIVKRRKRYALQGSWWRTSTLTYKFMDSPPYTIDLSDTDVERIIAQAFTMWSDVTNLRFQQVPQNEFANIDIRFATGDHGDMNPFDGPSGTLAHAFFPISGGDAHFDDAEEFTDGKFAGINLLFVAVHEFGHSLGLSHSDIQSAIMFPTYLGYVPNLQLHSDDIAGIQVLYGPPTTPPPTTTPSPSTTPTTMTVGSPTPPPPVDDFCRDGTVDAIGRLDGNTYVFQGEYYAVLDPLLGIVSGYPRRIEYDWPSLPNNVDAILDSLGEDHVFMFKDDRVWRYTANLGRFNLTQGYPKQISAEFTGLPNAIDMAMVWSGNGKSYVFKGDQYYRLSSDRTAVLRTYPLSISRWSLSNEEFTAVFKAEDDRTYFFYGQSFLSYNDTEMQPDADYPQGTLSQWFRCPDTVPGPDPTTGGSIGVSGSMVAILVVYVVQMLLS